VTERKPLSFEYCLPIADRWSLNKVYPTAEGGLVMYWREITDQKRAQ
jgi:hypothetical protein